MTSRDHNPAWKVESGKRGKLIVDSLTYTDWYEARRHQSPRRSSQSGKSLTVRIQLHSGPALGELDVTGSSGCATKQKCTKRQICRMLMPRMKKGRLLP